MSDVPYESDCILEFHGAVKGNRGSAGAGVVLQDVDGNLVYSSYSTYISHTYHHHLVYAAALGLLVLKFI